MITNATDSTNPSPMPPRHIKIRLGDDLSSGTLAALIVFRTYSRLTAVSMRVRICSPISSYNAVFTSSTCVCCSCCSRRSEEHTSELQSHSDLVCRLLLEKKKNT